MLKFDKHFLCVSHFLNYFLIKPLNVRNQVYFFIYVFMPSEPRQFCEDGSYCFQVSVGKCVCTHTSTQQYTPGVILGLRWITLWARYSWLLKKNGFLSWIIQSVCYNFILEPITWKTLHRLCVSSMFTFFLYPKHKVLPSIVNLRLASFFFWGIIFFFLSFYPHIHF